ncbi:hypothetical protein PJF56_13700 [Roseofilum sp. BLCC_M91]|uniref:Lipoprotein n=1 Tax=Roseofilum halophilum BLCC-M91 TaxID=3022259 RepID=A0ABT7BNQ0_9CYAN|nr:hypothetical protein [Roseofilum halophilum]MDJ1179918.1 hypothetical protein [Roseofilum halophilum BLCC-M91]
MISRTALGLTLIGALLLGGCEEPADPEIKQASSAMAQMATPRMLTRSCFYLVYPDGKASEFVSYLFSGLGAAEWPIAFDEMEEEQMKSVRMTPLPRTVRVSALKREYPEEKELVLIPDDENNQIMAQGYLADETDPTLETEWNLAIATPDEATQQLCRSNIELGIDGGTQTE